MERSHQHFASFSSAEVLLPPTLPAFFIRWTIGNIAGI
jgi:hypothetical protein